MVCNGVKSELDVKFLGRLVRYEVRKGNDSQPQRILIRGDGFTCTYDKELRSVYLTTKPSNEILGLEFDVLPWQCWSLINLSPDSPWLMLLDPEKMPASVLKVVVVERPDSYAIERHYMGNSVAHSVSAKPHGMITEYTTGANNALQYWGNYEWTTDHLSRPVLKAAKLWRSSKADRESTTEPWFTVAISNFDSSTKISARCVSL